MVEPPLDPDDRPSPEDMGRLALQLLRELALNDPALAERMRQLGLDPSAPS